MGNCLGRDVVWLHCYGERFVDPAAGRPKGAPRLAKEEAPFIPADGAIPGGRDAAKDIVENVLGGEQIADTAIVTFNDSARLDLGGQPETVQTVQSSSASTSILLAAC